MSWTEPMTEIDVDEADLAAVRACLESGWLTMGPRAQELEAKIAESLGVAHAVAVSNGSAAVDLALRVAAVGPGDEVILPATAPASSANAVLHRGAEIVLCDSRGQLTPSVCAESLESAINSRTKAVVAPHRWGYIDEIEPLASLCDERGVVLVEDARDAIWARSPAGAIAGSLGRIGCLSFSARRQLPVGEGGMLLTDDEGIAAQARSLRSHAMTSVTWERHRGHGLGYDITDIGYNYRIDEPHSALALSRLTRLSGEIDRRRLAAEAYLSVLADGSRAKPVFDRGAIARASHQVFPVCLDDRAQRDHAQQRLAAAGIESKIPGNLADYALYHDRSRVTDFPNAARISAEVLLLPMHGGLDRARVEAIALALPVRGAS